MDQDEMKNKLKCYISASTGFDLTKIETILGKLYIDYHSFYDISIGTTFSDLILRKMRESDFVIAILENENSNVLFELGIAEGLSKPTFIIVGKELKIPFFLQNKLYLQTNFTDTKLIELALSNFIIDVKEEKIKQERKKKTDLLTKEDIDNRIAQIQSLRINPNEESILHPIKETVSKLDIQNASISTAPIEKEYYQAECHAERCAEFIIDAKEEKTKTVSRKKKTDFLTKEDTDNIIAQIQSLRINPNEESIFHLIKETFSKLDIQNASISTAPIDKGIDLVIRSDKLSPYFGSPILVEVISGSLSQNRIIETQKRLWGYIKNSDAKGGIILYLDINNNRYENATFISLSILIFDLEDFILGIASEGLKKFLINKRNELAHGSKK